MAKGTYHIVRQGEHLSGIARKYGFSTYKTIWDHAQNEEVKKKRKDPNILFPGDRLYVPEKEAKEEARPTEKRHSFQIKQEKLELRVKVLDLSDEPIPGPCFLVARNEPNLMGDSENIFKGFIRSDLKEAELQFPEQKPTSRIPLAIGSLDPITKLSGQRERLNNLGYFAGFNEKSMDQFQWAVEEFQCDHLKEIGLRKPTGVCDEKTQKVLERVYGA